MNERALAVIQNEIGHLNKTIAVTEGFLRKNAEVEGDSVLRMYLYEIAAYQARIDSLNAIRGRFEG